MILNYPEAHTDIVFVNIPTCYYNLDLEQNAVVNHPLLKMVRI